MNELLEEIEVTEEANAWDEYEEVDLDEYRESYNDYISSYIY